MITPSVEAVLRKCAATPAWEQGMCGQFCAAMFGYGASGYRDAWTQWKQTPAALTFPGRTDAPPGALYFWSGGSAGHGHVAVAVGDGTCWSIDIGGPGTVSRVPASTISQRWGLPYLGWTVPYFQGSQWSPVSIYGTDVSMYQPINFALTLPSSGKQVDFAIIKVTEGSGWTSTRWAGQRQWAKDHGLVVGFYHFARPGSMVDQADRFLSLVKPEPGDILAFDWEDAGVTSAQKDAWIAYVQGKTDNRVILYCNTDFWKNRDTSSFAGDGLWIATGNIPAGQPPIQSAWIIHQYSTAGNYDHDLAQFSSRGDMRAWAGGDDVALSDADKAWIKSTIASTVAAAIKAEAYAATIGKDAVRSPDDAAANPTWATTSYLREGYLRLLEILALEKNGSKALSEILSQSQTNGTNATAANTKLDEIRATLAALDLSQLPADLAAKLETLEFSIKEKTA